MRQWEAVIIALFLEGPEWHMDWQVSKRVIELGLVHTKAEKFTKSVNMYLHRYGAGHVEHNGPHYVRTNEFRIRNHPDSKAYCVSLIKKYPQYLKDKCPQFFEPREP